MKTSTIFLVTVVLTASMMGAALAQDHQHDEAIEGQLNAPMDKDSEMSMHQMMNNPEMKKRMQKHLDMMQAMLNSDGMSREDMQAMMDNPEMKSMMKMHMRCSKMMAAGMQGEGSMSASETQEGEGQPH